jgi:hypothetical protein
MNTKEWFRRLVIANAIDFEMQLIDENIRRTTTEKTKEFLSERYSSLCFESEELLTEKPGIA